MKYTKNQKLWREFVEDTRDIDISSFIPKRSLAAPLWEYNERINDEARERLLEIANKFFEDLELNKKLGYEVEIADIVLTGSLAGYNWSKYSDADLHILIDFKDVDNKFDFVSDYFRAKISNWNKIHEIYINSFEVEIYVQDKNEPHVSNGIYSVLKDLWLQKPTRQRENIDFDDVRKKSTKIMNIIDSVEQLYMEQKYEEVYDFSGRLKEKIRKFRRCGLEKGGIYSPENLSFKVLRRNGYLSRLSGLSTNSYDKMMSLKENLNRNWKNFLIEEDKPKNTLYAFDFDNTLVSNNGRIYLKDPRTALTQIQFDDFKRKNKHLSDEDFDFSAFEGMVGGNTYEKTAKILVNALEKGQNVVILTARTNPEPVKQFLLDNFGAKLPVIAVNSPDYRLLGDSDPIRKANWIKKQILSGVNTIYYYEDSDNNIAEVQKLRYDDEISDKNVKIFIYKVIGTPGNAKIVQKEEEEYQKKVKSKHRRMKTALIKPGGQKTSAGGGPYKKKPEYKRSKSAPAGAGGS